MAVRLDKVPAKALRPAPPRAWLWLGLLALLLLGGAGGMVLFATPELRQQPMNFWGLALGMPLLIWSLLSFGRALLHITQQRAADGWDEAREEDVTRKIRRGRRSQQVLSVSLHTAVREPGQGPSTGLGSTGPRIHRACLAIRGGCATRWGRDHGTGADTDADAKH